MRRLALIVLLIALALPAVAQSKAHSAAQSHFLPLDQWRIALTSGNMKRFADFYSSDPPVEIQAKPANKTGADNEVAFWNEARKSGILGLKTEVTESKEIAGGKVLSVHIQFRTNTPNGPRTRYVLYQQLWQKQGEAWRIVKVAHSDVLKMQQPAKLNPALYNVNADARKEIDEAIAESAKDHKRIILMFGGNWCYDCHVLDNCFHQADVAPLLTKNFRLLHVDIGAEERKNADIVAKYNIPLNKGVPALAILDSDGKLLYSQQNGEFEAARRMDPDDIIAFLNKWKPAGK
jgi:ketosteroid isomerase-like protein